MQKLKFDVLNDPIKKIIVGVCVPLIIVTIISWLTTSVTNVLYSRFGGEYFTIQGLIGIVLTSITQVVSCVITASWIKTAIYYKEKRSGDEKSYFATSVYVTVIVETLLIVLCLFAKRTIFSLFYIPEQLYESASTFYTVGLLSYYLTSFGYFGLTLLNGVGNSMQLLVGNLINSCGTMAVACLMLGVFKLDLVGATLIAPICGVILALYSLIVLKKNKIPLPKSAKGFRLDKKLFFSILKTGLLMGAQSLLCQMGDICISVQTNKFVDLGLISLSFVEASSIGLPLTAVLNSFSTVCLVFIPPNHNAGNKKRVKKFLWSMMALTVSYGALLTLVYAFCGKFFYATVYEDPDLIALGARYWRYYSTSMIPVSILYVLRYYFDCIGRNRIAMFAGVMQMLGAVFAAFVIIPQFGEFGRGISTAIAFSFASVYLLVAYFLVEKLKPNIRRD